MSRPSDAIRQRYGIGELRSDIDRWKSGPAAVAICGPAGSGKTTLAELLCRERGFIPFKFADPLKDMLRAFYQNVGLCGPEIDRRLEGDMKELPCPYLGNRTPRHAMRTLGTEWGRDMIWSQLWLNVWSLRVGSAGRVNPYVSDDLRFSNEAAAVRAVGGVIVEVRRPGVGYDRSHPSEAGGVEPDFSILNSGAPEVMLASFDAATAAYRRAG